jgi:hypothetical protein
MAENLSLFRVRNSWPTCANLLTVFPEVFQRSARQSDFGLRRTHQIGCPRFGFEPQGRGVGRRESSREPGEVASHACVNGQVCRSAFGTLP